MGPFQTLSRVQDLDGTGPRERGTLCGSQARAVGSLGKSPCFWEEQGPGGDLFLEDTGLFSSEPSSAPRHETEELGVPGNLFQFSCFYFSPIVRILKNRLGF